MPSAPAPSFDRVTPRLYAGLFALTLATLMFQILLTRVFSVTMWYHFAFVAISVTMFGMTVGALLVYLLPAVFTPERTWGHLAGSSLAFGLAIIAALAAHLRVPFISDLTFRGFLSAAFTYGVVSIPFIFSGIAVTLALTRFPAHVSRLYAADLAGAALGCLLIVVLVPAMNGPSAALAVAAIAAVGAALFAWEGARGGLARASLACAGLGAALLVAHALGGPGASSLFRVHWVRGEPERPLLYEKWNSFSRIRVYGDSLAAEPPFGWGLSPVYPLDRTVRQLTLDIDGAAATILTEFDGDFRSVEHLKYDLSNIAHYLRPHARVLAIGTGGGRDVLGALAFGQETIVGVEINPAILDAANRQFGEFTGHLDRMPGVRFVNDEARSYLTRSRETFDIIQISLIDTWAATAAGAFVLTENSLYTVEAWQTFLGRLSDNGILTVSRWYYVPRPDEMYRLASLASAALVESGVASPASHMAIVRYQRTRQDGEEPLSKGTLLLSKSPFSDADLDTLDAVTARMQLVRVLSPRGSDDATFARLASGKDLARTALSTR